MDICYWEISHEDCTGVTGTLKPGTVEITTASKGIIHSEIPKSFDEWAEGT
jgi:redox-sensitive bicupin YhaK (pirin superfamily)